MQRRIKLMSFNSVEARFIESTRTNDCSRLWKSHVRLTALAYQLIGLRAIRRGLLAKWS
jgi:hypothetical protein